MANQICFLLELRDFHSLEILHSEEHVADGRPRAYEFTVSLSDRVRYLSGSKWVTYYRISYFLMIT